MATFGGLFGDLGLLDDQSQLSSPLDSNELEVDEEEEEDEEDLWYD